MEHIHRLTLVGKLNRPPVTRDLSNKTVASLSMMCVGKAYTTSDGEQKTAKHFFKITIWNDILIKTIVPKLQEGMTVFAQGNSKFNVYTDQNGKECTGIECVLSSSHDILAILTSDIQATSSEPIDLDNVPFS